MEYKVRGDKLYRLWQEKTYVKNRRYYQKAMRYLKPLEEKKQEDNNFKVPKSEYERLLVYLRKVKRQNDKDFIEFQIRLSKIMHKSYYHIRRDMLKLLYKKKRKHLSKQETKTWQQQKHIDTLVENRKDFGEQDGGDKHES